MSLLGKLKTLFSNSAIVEVDTPHIEVEQPKHVIPSPAPQGQPLKIESIVSPKAKREWVKATDIPNEFKPKALTTEYKLNEGRFDEFLSTLRPHQTEAITALSGALIGQINIPTGTGKTYIQKEIIVHDMIDKAKKNQPGVYVITAHRLALCTQLFNEVLDLLIPCGVKADMIFVGCSRFNYDKLNKKYQNLGFAETDVDGDQTTSGITIKNKVNEAQSKGNHTIIVSTYHSFHRLQTLSKIDICTFDEAHTTTNEQFTENIELVKPIIEKQYFFTATRRVFGEEGGQNNFEFYGDVLYEMSPRKAIELGEIVRPRLHFIIPTDENIHEIDANNIEMMVKTITGGFTEHKNKVIECSAHPIKLGAKMLVTVNGLKELHVVHENIAFQIWAKTKKINIFAFSSDKGDFHHFKTSGRQQALDAMNELNDADDAIIFHYDILTEGIDLPAITGVLLLRDLPTTKLLQNIGRGARLLKEDRANLYNNVITSTDLDKMIKPYCWVIIPQYLKTLLGDDRMTDIIKSIRDTYNIQLELFGQVDSALADKEHFADRVTAKDNSRNNNNVSDLEHIFEEIILDEFQEELSKHDNQLEYIMIELELV